MDIESKVKLGIYESGLMAEKLISIMKFCKESLNPSYAPRISGNVPSKVYNTASRFDLSSSNDGEMFMDGKYNCCQGNTRFPGIWETTDDDCALRHKLAECCSIICNTALANRTEKFGIPSKEFSHTNLDAFAIVQPHGLADQKEVKLTVRDAKFMFDFFTKQPDLIAKYGEEYYYSMVGYAYSPFVIAAIESLNKEIQNAERIEHIEYEKLLKEFDDKVEESRKRKSKKVQALNMKIMSIKEKANNQTERTKDGPTKEKC